VRHAQAAALDELGPLLVQLRELPGLTEKGPGRFYRGSTAFLHFHEDPSGTHADLKVDGEWERRRVATARERSQLLARARTVLGA